LLNGVNLTYYLGQVTLYTKRDQAVDRARSPAQTPAAAAAAAVTSSDMRKTKQRQLFLFRLLGSIKGSSKQTVEINRNLYEVTPFIVGMLKRKHFKLGWKRIVFN
jgi:hypothetical protein